MMFSREQHLEKLRQLHDKIERMNEGKEKLLLMLNYSTYCAILYNLYPLGEFPFDAKEFFNDKTFKKYQKYFILEVKDIYDSTEILRWMFSNVEVINSEYKLDRKINYKDEINSRLGMLLVYEFFNTLPDNIRRIYQEIINGNILFTLEGESMAYNTDYWNGGKIKCYAKPKDYYMYMTIVHEIGHCYHYRLNTQGNNFNFLRPDIEVASIFMEIIFNNFVDEYLHGMSYGINCMLYRQTWFAELLKFQEMFLANSEWLNITGEKQVTGVIDYQEMTLEDLKTLKENKISLSNEEKKNGLFLLEVNVEQFRYTISNLLAIYFADVYRYDQKEGLRMLKDYLMLPPGVTLEEKLSMYDLTGDSYKRMVKKVSDYGKGKYLL